MSARTRAEKRKKLTRVAGDKPEKRTIRVFSEGEATEVEYLEAVRKTPSVWDSVSLQISVEMVGATPMTLVDAAANAKRNASLEIDEYWCVFDVEAPQSHPYLDRARVKAHDNGIHLAYSNPCFEVWLALHHHAQTAYLSTDEAISLRERREADVATGIVVASGKHLDGAFYMANLDVAMRRARALRERHIGNGTDFPDDNPSSRVDLLMSSLGVDGSDRSVLADST